MNKNKIKVLGELESEIMEAIWACGQASVRCVLDKLQKRKKVAYTTVMTVMSRLYEKGILSRKMDKSGAFIYLPVDDKKTFLQKTSANLIKSFVREYGDVAVAQFFDIIEFSDLKKSAEWKDKLKKILEK